MRIQQPYGAKPDYYDRRVSRVIKSVSPEVQSPSGAVTQWEYTVPEGRLFFVEHVLGLLGRETPSSNPQYAYLRIFVTPVSQGPLDLVHLRLLTNFTHRPVYMSQQHVVVLEPGDKITCQTYDSSPDGTMRYVGTMIGFVFEP